MPITLPVPGGGGANNSSSYYNGTNLGEYQFVSLSEIIDNFIAAYVGEGKILENVLDGDVHFHAHRALQELHYDTLKSCKSQEIEVCPSLKMPLPHDYVNYVKLTSVDSQGIEHVLYPASKTSNPFAVVQTEDCKYSFGEINCGVGRPPTYGCTDPSALNTCENECESCEDGTSGEGSTCCVYAEVDLINGCTNVLADNYNPAATIDDGTCYWMGCMDPEANNHNPIATISDDSCMYGDGYEGGTCTERTLVPHPDGIDVPWPSGGQMKLLWKELSKNHRDVRWSGIKYLKRVSDANLPGAIRNEICLWDNPDGSGYNVAMYMPSSSSEEDISFEDEALYDGSNFTNVSGLSNGSGGHLFILKVNGTATQIRWHGSFNALLLHIQALGVTGITNTTTFTELESLIATQWGDDVNFPNVWNGRFRWFGDSSQQSPCYCRDGRTARQKVKVSESIKQRNIESKTRSNISGRRGTAQPAPVLNLSEQCTSNTWANYSGNGYYEEINTSSTDNTTTVANFGQRYGIDPQYAQNNGSFFMDCRLGNIHFSGNLSGRTIILKYISDGHGTPDEAIVPKLAEEAMYKWIAYGLSLIHI